MTTWKSIIRFFFIFVLFNGCTSGDSGSNSSAEADTLAAEVELDEESSEALESELDDEFSDELDGEFTDADFGDEDFDDSLDGNEDLGSLESVDLESVDSDFDSSFENLEEELSAFDEPGGSGSEAGDFEASASLADEELGDQGFDDDFTVDEFIADAEPEDGSGLGPVGDGSGFGDDVSSLDSNESYGDGDGTDFGASGSQNVVTNLEYKSFESGGTVVIETSQPPVYTSRKEESLNQIIIEVENTILPERFKRPYLTKDFDQDVATINGYQAEGDSTAKFVVQMKRAVTPLVQVSGNSLLVMTDQSGDANAALAGAVGGSGDGAASYPGESYPEGSNSVGEGAGSGSGDPQFAKASSSPDDSSFGSSPDPNGNGLPDDSNTLAPIAYQGKKINLEYADTPVREVIQMIAEDSGVNLIIDRDVEGTVNLRLREVPWDQALNVVLKSQGLGYRRDGNVLRIAKQQTLSQEATALKEQIENENKAKLEAGGLKVKYIPVSYAKVEEMTEKLQEFLSPKGAVTTDKRTSAVVVSDYAEYIDRISKLIKAMDTPPLQVEIESKIIEARDEFTRDVGVNLGIVGEEFSSSGGVNTSFDLNSPNSFDRTRGLFSSFRSGSFNILGNLSATLALYENENKIKILSSPRIMVMNKEKSVIRQKTQIPILSFTANQGQVVESVRFKDVVLSLEVSPQVTFTGDVILDVAVTREFASGQEAQTERAINTREAETTVMVKNGETAVIGGIYESDVATIKEGVPVLKDIPIIGSLFRFKQKIDNKNELLVFLRPRIVKNLNDAIVQSKKDSDAFDESFEDEDIVDGEVL